MVLTNALTFFVTFVVFPGALTAFTPGDVHIGQMLIGTFQIFDVVGR